MSENKRGQARNLDVKNASVEFQPQNAALPYHFKLRDYSGQGLGILVRSDSRVLDLVEVGDEMEMKYFPDDDRPIPFSMKIRVCHITPPENGKPLNHLIVGLYILEKDQ